MDCIDQNAQSGWIYFLKIDSDKCFYKRLISARKLRVMGQKKMFHTSGNQNKAGVGNYVFTSEKTKQNKTDYKPKMVKRKLRERERQGRPIYNDKGVNSSKKM